jgi:hypothetical protein
VNGVIRALCIVYPFLIEICWLYDFEVVGWRCCHAIWYNKWSCKYHHRHWIGTRT